MVMAGTCGNLSLEVVKRYMRRILGPRGMGKKQDALSLKGDPLMANSPLHVASPYDEASDYPPRGDALVTSKKKGKKRKTGQKGFSPVLPANRPTNVATPNRINPRLGRRNRCFGCGSEFHLPPKRPGPTPKAARRV